MSSPCESPAGHDADADADADDFVEDHDLWTSGDVSLISADNVRFRVASLTLAWSSPVFADMLALPSRPGSGGGAGAGDATLRLSDDAIEGADVVCAYLDLVSLHTERLGVFFRGHARWRRLLVRLTHFLDKYQSERGLKLLRSFGAEGVALHRFVRLGDLVFAALVNDLALCFRVLSSPGAHRASSASSADRGDRKGLGASEGSWQLALGHQAYDTACAIPLPFQWAIARAAEAEDHQMSPRLFAHKFMQLMKEINAQGAPPAARAR